MQDYGVDLEREEIDRLFTSMDKDGTGSLDFDEFIANLRPPLNNTRKKLIRQAFNKLDQTGDGQVTVEDLRGVYDATQHPKYKNGDWSENRVFVEFLKNFDTPGDDLKCVIKYGEFLSYYSGVSASIDNDMYFDVVMRKAWRL